MRTWLLTVSAVAVGGWLALTTYYFTADLLTCFPLARLWAR